MKISEKLKDFIKTIDINILMELWEISQEYEYKFDEDDNIIWGVQEEFWSLISNANREGNNPGELF